LGARVGQGILEAVCHGRRFGARGAHEFAPAAMKLGVPTDAARVLSVCEALVHGVQTLIEPTCALVHVGEHLVVDREIRRRTRDFR